MSETITKLEIIVNGKDDNGNVVHSEILEFPQDQETIHDLSVGNDGSIVIVELTSGVGGRPKNKPSPSAK